MVNILFFGTPEISVPFLKNLVGLYNVAGVICQPDRPADRGYQLHAPPVKIFAQERNIPVFQPEKYTPEIIEQFKNLNTDVGVIVSYGKIIPEAVFTIPKNNCFNIHFSLLPKYRGAAPVQWSLIKGEKETGVTAFWIEKGLDTGPIIKQNILPISDEDDAVSLFEKLIPLGIKTMNEALNLIEIGKAEGIPQEGNTVYAPSLSKEDGKIEWSKPSREIFNLIRGARIWPGTYTIVNDGKLQGKRLKILRAALCEGKANLQIGQIIDLIKNKGFVVQCGDGALLIEEVQPENKKPMTAWAFWQGGSLKVGDKIA